ncbi:hypothetical protein QF038_002322 [Pseudarthrobacter sp. W1I19]|nr:hypothetical protein [Pseudarthrobacter sp. W1I19]
MPTRMGEDIAVVNRVHLRHVELSSETFGYLIFAQYSAFISSKCSIHVCYQPVADRI